MAMPARTILRATCVLAAGAALAAQQAPPLQAPPQPQWVAVTPISPAPSPLPPEEQTANVTQFSFFAYGDTRSGPEPGGDGVVLQAEHAKVVDKMIATAQALSATPFPARFVLQSGDAVLRGASGAMWNVSFSPIIERLTKGAGLPYFFAVGNHDVGNNPAGDPGRAIGLHNTLTAMSKLIPPEGSPRRLVGYPTYAFGYGNTFFVALDSDIAADTVQLSWITNQLEHLDRARYHNIVVFFHHPPYSSGPHSGASGQPIPGTGVKAPDRTEPQSVALRQLYMPLFRKHHVRLIVTGHDHLFDHWVEHYGNSDTPYRMDTLVTGGGGAPTYLYAGEPDLRGYISAAPNDNIRIEHLVKPGSTADENPHHFVVVRVDGDRLSVEVIASRDAPYTPYAGGRSRVALSDGGS